MIVADPLTEQVRENLVSGAVLAMHSGICAQCRYSIERLEDVIVEIPGDGPSRGWVHEECARRWVAAAPEPEVDAA